MSPAADTFRMRGPGPPSVRRFGPAFLKGRNIDHEQFVNHKSQLSAYEDTSG
jgi:hypothetical protein